MTKSIKSDSLVLAFGKIEIDTKSDPLKFTLTNLANEIAAGIITAPPGFKIIDDSGNLVDSLAFSLPPQFPKSYQLEATGSVESFSTKDFTINSTGSVESFLTKDFTIEAIGSVE